MKSSKTCRKSANAFALMQLKLARQRPVPCRCSAGGQIRAIALKMYSPLGLKIRRIAANHFNREKNFEMNDCRGHRSSRCQVFWRGGFRPFARRWGPPAFRPVRRRGASEFGEAQGSSSGFFGDAGVRLSSTICHENVNLQTDRNPQVHAFPPVGS